MMKEEKSRWKKKGKYLEGIGGSTEERNDGVGNNGILEAGRKQIFEGCTKRREELDCVNETVCISVPKPKMGMYFV